MLIAHLPESLWVRDLGEVQGTSGLGGESLVQQQVGADLLGDHLKGCFTLISGAGLRRLRLGEWGWGGWSPGHLAVSADFPAW